MKYLHTSSRIMCLSVTLLILIIPLPSTILVTQSRGLGSNRLSLKIIDASTIGWSPFCLMISLSSSFLKLYGAFSLKGMQYSFLIGGICAGSPMNMILIVSLYSIKSLNKSSLSIDTSSTIKYLNALRLMSLPGTNFCSPLLLICSFKPNSLCIVLYCNSASLSYL